MTQQEAVLRGFLSKYKHPNETRTDIINTVTQYRDLRPSLDPFVFNDGTERELVQLEGTIPIIYKGKSYNIPVSIWILDTHPYNPPMVFVKPTNTMHIKPGSYVDANGKVDMPFIREWRHVLTFMFGEECPVFSRASGQMSQGVAPYPGQMSYLTGTGAVGLPYPPPGFALYPPGSYPVMYPLNPVYVNPGPQVTAPYAGGGGAYTASQFNGQTPYVAPHSIGESVRITPGGTVTEADLRASLLSAVEDKIRWRFRETYAQAQAEMDVLCKTQKELNEGQHKLNKIVSDLDKEKDEIERNIQILRASNSEVKDTILKMEGKQDGSIDDAVVTTAPLYKQLLDAFAEEQATEDAIYYLGEALRKNVIELESFLKRVRELSRRQFMLRATIQKCREKAGLPALV